MCKKIGIYLIQLYQRNAPQRIRKSCRFEPSCSEYSIQAIEKYGILKGSLLTTKRLFRCRPPNGGTDPLI